MVERNQRLHTITRHLHIWSPQPNMGWGLANCGLITSGADAAWIDSPYDSDLASEFMALGRPLMAEGTHVSRIVVTHGNGDHHWGAVAVPEARIITTEETVSHLDHEPEPAQVHALVHGSDPDTPLGWYLRRSFGRFNWAGQTGVRRPDTVFTGELELSVGGIPVQLTSLPPAHTGGDLIAHLPSEGVVFTGDIVFGSTPETPGDHPVHWAGPLANVVAACQRVRETGAEVVVPGHGPILDPSGLHDHIRYLEYLIDRAHRFHAAGVPAWEAARRIVDEGRYPELGLPERLLATIGTEYRHLEGSTGPADMAMVIAEVAWFAWELEHPGVPVPRSPGARHTGLPG
jgi:cyclase